MQIKKPNLITLLKYDNQYIYVGGPIVSVVVAGITTFVWDWTFGVALTVCLLIFAGIIYGRYDSYKKVLTKFTPDGSDNSYYLFSKVIHNKRDGENYLEDFLLDYESSNEDYQKLFKQIPTHFFPDIYSYSDGEYSGKKLQAQYTKARKSMDYTDILELRSILSDISLSQTMASVAMSQVRMEQRMEKWTSSSAPSSPKISKSEQTKTETKEEKKQDYKPTEKKRGTAILEYYKEALGSRYYKVKCFNCGRDQGEPVITYRHSSYRDGTRPRTCNYCGAFNKVIV